MIDNGNDIERLIRQVLEAGPAQGLPPDPAMADRVFARLHAHRTRRHRRAVTMRHLFFAALLLIDLATAYSYLAVRHRVHEASSHQQLLRVFSRDFNVPDAPAGIVEE